MSEDNNTQSASKPVASQPNAIPVAQSNTAVQAEGVPVGLPQRETTISIISEFKGSAHVKIETKNIPPPDIKSD